MIDEREHLERALRRFRPESGIVERVYRRRDRKQRNQRIAAAVVGLVLAGTAWGVLARSFLSHEPVPADETTTPTPVGSVRFESPLYGYSIDVPVGSREADSIVTPATIPWAWGEPRRADVITISGGTFSFDISIASVAIPDGVSEEEWQRREERQFRDVKAGTCREDPTIGSIELDSVPGRILTACDGDLFITLVVQDRGYVLATYGSGVVDNMREFRAIIDTLVFHPEQAPDVPESASEWRGIWPQTTREDARAAQERADAAGSESFWQVDWMQEGIVARRFVEDVLGWDGSRAGATGYVPGNAEQAWEAEVVFWSVMRCADGINPLYPDHPRMGDCAPTIDETHFERVIVRAEQLIRPGRSGIWLVTGWEEAGTVEQAVPRTEEEARALMTAYLEARLSGSGAEPLVECCQGLRRDYELNLYETSGGSPYVGYEIDWWGPSRPEWPSGGYLFRVTLFAEDGTTVEEWPYLVGPAGGEQKVSGCCYFQTRERTP